MNMSDKKVSLSKEQMLDILKIRKFFQEILDSITERSCEIPVDDLEHEIETIDHILNSKD